MGREDLREELGRPCLKEGTVTHFDRAGRLGGQGLAVDGEAGGGLDDDLTLIGALVDDASRSERFVRAKRMASSTEVLPAPLGPEISTDFPSRVVSRMPEQILNNDF